MRRSVSVLSLAATACFALAASGAAAAEPPTPATPTGMVPQDVRQLSAYLASDSYRDRLQAAIGDIDAALPTLCKKMDKTVRSEPVLLEPVGFTAGAKADTPPVRGVWYEHLSFEGCNGLHALSLLMQAEESGPPRWVPLLPGTTVASPDLQLDAVKLVREKAAAVFPGCAAVQVVQTNFRGFDDKSDPAARLKDMAVDALWQTLPQLPDWSEDWMVLGCTGLLPMDMHFLHVDRDGQKVFAIQADPQPVLALPQPQGHAEPPAPAPTVDAAPAGSTPPPTEATAPHDEPAETQPGAPAPPPAPTVTDTSAAPR